MAYVRSFLRMGDPQWLYTRQKALPCRYIKANVSSNVQMGRRKMNEQWKPIPGYEGRYEVSDQGRVRSLTRRVRLVTRAGNETHRLSKGRLLRPGRTRTGHVTVALGRGNSRPVHQLVLEAFVGPRPQAPKGSLIDVLHLNGIPDDNRLENLRYGTRAENIRQDLEAGIRKISAFQQQRMYEGRIACGMYLRKRKANK